MHTTSPVKILNTDLPLLLLPAWMIPLVLVTQYLKSSNSLIGLQWVITVVVLFGYIFTLFLCFKRIAKMQIQTQSKIYWVLFLFFVPVISVSFLYLKTVQSKP